MNDTPMKKALNAVEQLQGVPEDKILEEIYYYANVVEVNAKIADRLTEIIIDHLEQARLNARKIKLLAKRVEHNVPVIPIYSIFQEG